ncbi:hypothetical protein [Treponema lecithinolyticum]|uniref:gp53-like domain-containing protein n=1 Tax=Treponema lecithinolyticum TaxID=53418 RepID=UPI0028E3C75F|nr:hypothetical protein [Treponema lecithinolyticum]
MADMYPENQNVSIFGETVQWPGLNSDGKFTNGSFDDPLVKPSFIPAETLNLILDNLGGMITKLGGTPNNTSAAQLADLFVSTATANKGVVRDADGRAQVSAPAVAADIARKAEVDAAIRFVSGYGVSATESTNTGKTVEIEGVELVAGRRICVKFTHGNTASEPTLNVNNLGAMPITMDGQPVYTGCFDDAGVYEFMYDGAGWECVSGVVRARNFGENAGYIKLRNGLLIQSAYTPEYYTTENNVMFPLSFSIKCFGLAIVSCANSNSVTNAFHFVKKQSLTKAGFVLKGFWNGGVMGNDAYYIAIGF